MGSHGFGFAVYTTDTASQAYAERASVDMPQDVTIVRTPAPMTRAEAVALSNTRIDAMSTWEPTQAVAIVAETAAEYEHTGTHHVTLTLPGATYNDPSALRAAIAADLGISPDDIEHYRVHFDATATAKVTAAATKGKAETRYFCLVTGTDRMPKWEDGWPTQAEARAALPTLLARSFDGFPSVEAEIVSMTRRVSGEALVTATVAAKTVTATLVVTTHRLVKPATRGTEQAGWYFYGWEHE
jgi:hypothetical protein